MEENAKIKLDPSIVDVFTIDDGLAKELSEVLTKITIRHNLLLDLTDKPVKYEEIEKELIPLEERKSALMNKITTDYVPDKYRSDSFSWYFAGYSVAKNECWIKKT